MERDENDVQKVVTCFKSGLMKDPFAEENDSLSNITTDVVLPAGEAERLLASEENGKAQNATARQTCQSRCTECIRVQMCYFGQSATEQSSYQLQSSQI